MSEAVRSENVDAGMGVEGRTMSVSTAVHPKLRPLLRMRIFAVAISTHMLKASLRGRPHSALFRHLLRIGAVQEIRGSHGLGGLWLRSELKLVKSIPFVRSAFVV